MKIVAAFLAGLIIACFAALIYVKETRPTDVPPAEVTQAQPSPSPEPAGKAESAAETPAPVDDGEPAEAPPATSVPARKPASKPVHPETHPRTRPAHPASEIARNEAPPAPEVGPAPDASSQPQAPPPPQAEPQQPAPPTVSAPPIPAAPPAPAVREPMTVTLPAGLTIAVRMGEALSTDHNYTGDTFRATLDQPIIMNGFIIADKGSKVLGRVGEADKPGRVKAGGQLLLALTEINTTDGQRVRIETESWAKQAPNTRGRDAAEIGAGAALGAIIGAIAGGGKGAAIGAGAGGAAGTAVDLGTRGKAAVVPVETHLTFHLQNPITITEKLN